MKNRSTTDRILDHFANNSGEQKTGEIAKAISASSGSTSSKLGDLAKIGKLVKIKKGVYRLNDEGASTERSEAQNKSTINKLLNVYDQVLDRYSEVLEQKMTSDADTVGDDHGVDGTSYLLRSLDKKQSVGSGRVIHGTVQMGR